MNYETFAAFAELQVQVSDLLEGVDWDPNIELDKGLVRDQRTLKLEGNMIDLIAGVHKDWSTQTMRYTCRVEIKKTLLTNGRECELASNEFDAATLLFMQLDAWCECMINAELQRFAETIDEDMPIDEDSVELEMPSDEDWQDFLSDTLS